MSKEVITSAILVIVSVIAAVAFVNAILPSVYGLSESYSSVALTMEDQFKTDLDIIFIYPDGDDVYVWIKNVGSSDIPLSQLQLSDIFVMSSSGYWNPSFESASNPSWDYTLENGDGDTWNRGETIKVSIKFDADELSSGIYKVTFFLYNGVSTSDTFSR
jgi:flagellar protein FlaG